MEDETVEEVEEAEEETAAADLTCTIFAGPCCFFGTTGLRVEEEKDDDKEEGRDNCRQQQVGGQRSTRSKLHMSLSIWCHPSPIQPRFSSDPTRCGLVWSSAVWGGLVWVV